MFSSKHYFRCVLQILIKYSMTYNSKYYQNTENKAFTEARGCSREAFELVFESFCFYFFLGKEEGTNILSQKNNKPDS